MIGYLSADAALIHAFRSEPASGRRRGASKLSSRIFKMAPKLSDFFEEGEIIASRGNLDQPFSGLAMDSRRVVPGNVFFALPGLRSDGATYADEAIGRGAVAIVCPRLPVTVPARVTFIQVADPRATLARVAQRYFRFPDRELDLIGITGTNGKTTVAHLLKHLLEEPSRRVGLLGTIHYDLGARTVPSFKTTPESLDIHGMLAQMRDAGCRQAVLEVSSHGIDQQRVLGMRFAAAVFTNLTRDHLDFHKTLDAYFEVKSRLFTGGVGPVPGLAVVNLDDPRGQGLVARITAEYPSVRVITFGEHPAAQVRAEALELGFRSSAFRLTWQGASVAIPSPLIGRYNVSNLLAAFATALALGRTPESLVARLASFRGVPGRMERIEVGQGFNVIVDYAHTDDALRNALGMLRAITPGRLLVVFGCGGNRDRSKRPLMVRAVQDFADQAFATADNPRGEGLPRIFDDMRGGVSDASKITWIDDRRRALSLALDMALPGDCLLIAGKGHECYQEFADTVIPFDDRQVLRELIAIKALMDPRKASS
jgi:UDP-N-acetylmuramoyl-L-alanyl-D-glutamate--2,6-diaminopimelate ligase